VSTRLLYLDSSAILKLAVPEPESRALFKMLGDWPIRVSSELARTEVARALRRVGATAPQFRRGQKALERIGLMPVDRRILSDAAGLKAVSLRSLDAIHLATALSLGSAIAALVTYDGRLSAAAIAARLPVWSPGP
jgi:predicted nucleic acid-binding protein